MTLRDVAVRSKRRFKPSAVGGYERGERGISLERFCDLTAALGVPADRLLSQILSRVTPHGRREPSVDLTQPNQSEDAKARDVAENAHIVKARRNDDLTDVSARRAGESSATVTMPRSMLNEGMRASPSFFGLEG